MRWPYLSLSLLSLALAGLSSARRPAKPGLTYLYTANIVAGPSYDAGLGPHGTQSITAITSGNFSGPLLNGILLPVGGDWGVADANGTFYPDVRQTFQTNDGAIIQVYEAGASQTDKTVHVHMTFETGSQKYWWLNSVVAIGIIRAQSSGGLEVDAWQRNTPS